MNKIEQLSKINTAFVLGTCVGLSGQVQGLPVYLIKPPLTGRMGEPVRVVTSLSLSPGTTYYISGSPNTSISDKGITSLYIEAANVIKAPFENPIQLDIDSNLAKCCAVNFLYIEDMSVSAIKKTDSGYILGLEKILSGPRFTTHITTKGIITSKYLDSQKFEVGQLVSVFGAVQADSSKARDSKSKEVNIKILKLNPSQSEISEWLSISDKLTKLSAKSKLSALTDYPFVIKEKQPQ